MTREEHYRAALEAWSKFMAEGGPSGTMYELMVQTRDALAAGGALPAEDTEARKYDGGWRNLADLIAMSFRDDDAVAMDYLHQLCGYVEAAEARLAIAEENVRCCIARIAKDGERIEAAEARLERMQSECKHIAELLGSAVSTMEYDGAIDGADVLFARDIVLRIARGEALDA